MRSSRAGETAEVRRPGTCRMRELELTAYPLFQIHLTQNPSDRREHDGVELAQLGRRLDGEQVLESSSRLLEPLESGLERKDVIGVQCHRRSGVIADELPERVDAGRNLAERLREPEVQVGQGRVLGRSVFGGVDQCAEH